METVEGTFPFDKAVCQSSSFPAMAYLQMGNKKKPGN
jgi:hypothetical protein